MLFAGAVSAHETMFGLGPRTIWNKGFEVELTQRFDWGGHFFSGNNMDENPRDERRFLYEPVPAMTYGFSRDFAMRIITPYYHLRVQTKDDTETFSGAAKFSVGGVYRFLNNVFPGGSTKASWFLQTDLPTATNSRGRLTDSQFDDNWVFTFGLAVASGSTRHYVWADFAGRGSTQIDGTGPGPEFQTHLSYAYRFWSLTDYKALDFIMLVEGDFKVAAQGMLMGDRDENSGGFAFHLAVGFQLNISNHVEMKFGINIPVYKFLYGVQFYHDMEASLMFSYLI